MKLSTNFSLKELTDSSTAVRLNIDNSLPDALLGKAKSLCTELLQPVRKLCGNKSIHINSGYRCLDLNRALHSSDNSQHVKMEAADIVVKGLTPMEVATKVAESDLEFDQLILEFGNWVHISRTDEAPRKQILTIYRENGKVKTLSGIHDK